MTRAVTGTALLIVLLISTNAFAGAETSTPSTFGRPDESDALAVAYDCLASLALARSPADLFVSRAVVDGNRLLELGESDKAGRYGWSYTRRMTPKSAKCGVPGALSTFGRKECNPPGTPYMIQTGYAVTCLAQLALVTSDDKWITSGAHAMRDSWNLGTSVPGDGFYYWYGYDPSDADRYVRNTNAIMGSASAWMFAATKESRYRDRAAAVARAEDRENRAGNMGYFGIDDERYARDPAGEARRIDNHLVHQIKALRDIGAILGDKQVVENARVLLDVFMNCDESRCRTGNCKSWAAPISCLASATIAPCILVDIPHTPAALFESCDAVRRALPRWSAFQVFMTFGPRDADDLISRTRKSALEK